MRPDDSILFLKKIRIEQLTPKLKDEVVEFAKDVGFEKTDVAVNKIDFIYKVFKKQQRTAYEDQKRLKKAEKLIMKLNTLHQRIMNQERTRRKDESKRKVKLKLIEGGMSISKKTRDLLGSIGITDESIMSQAEELFGLENIKERVEFVEMMTADSDVVKKLFSMYPETILIPDMGDFISELEAIDTKKEMIDGWSNLRGSNLPPWADFDTSPGILLDSFHDIERLLELKLPEPVEEKKEVKYRGKPMNPRDFIKVVEALGFEAVRETKHGLLMRRGDSILCVQRSHRAQAQLNRSVVKIKLTEAGVDLDRFENTRKGLRL